MKQVTVASIAVSAALLLIEEATLGLALSLLSPDVRNALISERALLTIAVLLLILSIALLWSIAFTTARAMKEYRSSNERSHHNDALFAQTQDHVVAILSEIEEVSKKQSIQQTRIEEAVTKLDLLEEQRERIVQEIVSGERNIVLRAASESAAAIEDRLANRRSHLETEVLGWKAGLTGEVGMLRARVDEIAARLEALAK